MQTLLLLCLLAVFVPRSEAVAADEPTFIDIRNQCVGTQCARGQWAVNIALGDSTRPGQWTRMYPGNATHPLGTCSTPNYDACFNETSPLGMPIKVRETAQMQVTFQWRNQFNRMVLFNKTNMQPQRMEFKLCYSNVAFLNRAWRRKNKPYPRLSQNCPFHVRDVEINRTMNPLALTQADKDAMSGTFVYDFNDDTMPTGTLYLMMWLRCTDSKVCGWESMESPFYAVPQEGILVYPPDYSSAYPAPFNVPGPYNGTYIQTEVYNGITPGMTAAAIVLSIFGPVFFIVYFIADHISYTKTGKALAW